MTTYDKINGVARGGMVGGSGMRSRGCGIGGVGRGGYEKFGEVEEEQRYGETLFVLESGYPVCNLNMLEFQPMSGW